MAPQVELDGKQLQVGSIAKKNGVDIILTGLAGDEPTKTLSNASFDSLVEQLEAKDISYRWIRDSLELEIIEPDTADAAS